MLRHTRYPTLLVLASLIVLELARVTSEDSTAHARSLRPRIVEDHIPFGNRRKRQMARYSRRHYGRARWRLRSPKVIVLHFTAGPSYSSAWNHFASNAPARGELPGVCAHFLIGKRGKIGEVVPTTIRCRHAIGLNHRSIGVEMVQETGRGSHWAARQILHRRRQSRAALRLVAYLKQRFDIRLRHIIGHAMANSSPYFRDLQGWRNDHTDWLRRDVRTFRRRLARFLQPQETAHRAFQSTQSPAPARVRRVRIGRSTQGRPIRALRIGDFSSRHTALVVGCIHGNEPAGKRIVRALRTSRPPDDLNLWLIKDLNPDGSAAGTRQNGRGVDLNRNFRRKWRPIGERWDTYYSGPRPFSEPESRAARDFIRRIRPDVTIWYHQAMALVDRSGPGRRIRRRYARLVGLPLRSIGPLPGTASRWQNHHFPDDVAFVVELPGGSLAWRAAKRHARAVRAVGRM